jgi:hypothetical protein
MKKPAAAKPSWIWTEAPLPARNAFVRFRRVLGPASGRLVIRITADSRYWLYVNGEYLGTGPVRSWPRHWKFDEYEVPAASPGSRNVVAVLVNHYGEGNFQYIAAKPGLWVDIRGKGAGGAAPARSDAAWRCSPSRANLSRVPRISVQEGFEEQFDARLDDDWTAPGYDDSRWARAMTVSPSHARLEPRGIPFLTRDPVVPHRVLRAERVLPASATWNLALKPYFAPDDFTSNLCLAKGFVFTQVWTKAAQTVEFIRPHHHASRFKVNGRTHPAIPTSFITPLVRQPVRLRAGWNQVLFPYPGLAPSADVVDPAQPYHFPFFVLAVSARQPLRWAARADAGGAPWAFVGPFAYTEAEKATIRRNRDTPHVVWSEKPHPSASPEAFSGLYARGRLREGDLRAPFFQPIAARHTITADVTGGAMADRVAGPYEVDNPNALLSGGAEWAVIPPPADGSDVRLLIDFGRAVVGNHVLEVDAEAGTIVDFHNFEFIQADGAENYADGMNNSLRYVCRGGRQSFRSLQRRGFQYSWLIARNLRSPLRIRRVGVEFSTYPQARRGAFACSDDRLNRIWETGAHTLRCCSEDTYVDCPTYEQTHWVGDARNEALIDWVLNGDGRLWFRCLEQVGQSLDFAPITLSNVPSAWTNVLPAWSSLWMRSCSEYLLWTGDTAGAARLLPWVERNVDGIERHLNARGLFEIRAWNMFDWADMDTPDMGVVTHNNCFMVLALKDCARMADWLGRKAVARRFRALAGRMTRAINRHLWDDGRRAYVDSIHDDGTVSRVFSQQTQTAALMAGVAAGARERRCRAVVHSPPEGFVRAGSPFFEFFLLEVLATEGKTEEFLDVIRSDWGFMIDQGATTFWEMWSNKSGRLTRSHCHGWSAAPTFFLSTEILGVRPTRPGFAACTVNPKLGKLGFLRGSVPTPRGVITVSCKRKGRSVKTSVTLPPGVRLEKS